MTREKQIKQVAKKVAKREFTSIKGLFPATVEEAVYFDAFWRGYNQGMESAYKNPKSPWISVKKEHQKLINFI